MKLSRQLSSSSLRRLNKKEIISISKALYSHYTIFKVKINVAFLKFLLQLLYIHAYNVETLIKQNACMNLFDNFKINRIYQNRTSF